MKKDLLKGLTDEQIEKAKSCKTHEELLAVAEEEGVDLTEEQLDAINGGFYCRSTPDFKCPVCQSKNVKSKYNENSIAEWYTNTCQDCGHVWIADA